MPKPNSGGKRNKTAPAQKPKWTQKQGEHPDRNDELIDYLNNANTSSMSPEMAMSRTNPNFDVDSTYKQNCQRCVWAYELQRRGYDVEALPTFQGDDLPRNGNWQMLDKNYHTNYKNRKYVGQQYGQTNSVKTEITNINEAMADWGEGSRAICRVVWKGGRSGHVFNVENIGGTVRAFDGQTGKEIKLRDYLSKAQRGMTSLVRSDNVEMNMDEISKYVKLRGQ